MRNRWAWATKQPSCPITSWTSGLDPLTNPYAAGDKTIEDAVFGQLFELGPGGTTAGLR